MVDHLMKSLDDLIAEDKGKKTHGFNKKNTGAGGGYNDRGNKSSFQKKGIDKNKQFERGSQQ